MKLTKILFSGLLCSALFLSVISCSKSLIDEEAATCETFLLGLNYECADNTCSYTASIENKEGEEPVLIEIDQKTFDHYKSVAEEKKENVCWQGMIE